MSPSSKMAVEGVQSLLRHFPPNAYSFAYGSAVFRQKNQPLGKMIDLIFVVDNPAKWHSENIGRNPKHYSFLKYLGTARIVKIQETWAAGVYYNTLVKVEDRMIKYGVISTHTLLDDLKNWTHAYISGRLHKPVLELSPPTNSHLVKCIKQNRLSALRTVLLQLPTQCKKWDLYHGITELSYFGDSRMRFGENPNKVKNILAGNVPHFDEIYQPLIQELNPLIEFKGGHTLETFVQDTSSKARLNHLLHLPFHLQRCICRESGRDPALHDVEEVLVEISSLPGLGGLVRRALGNIVWKSSIRQTAQGILTAGPFKAIRYGLEKVGKKISGSREAKAPLAGPTIVSTPVLPQEIPKQEVKTPKIVESKTRPKTTESTPTSPVIISGSGSSSVVAESNQSSHHDSDEHQTPNLSDLELPFAMKRSAQETEQERVRQALITVKVKGQDPNQLASKAQIAAPAPMFSLEGPNTSKAASKSAKENTAQDSNPVKPKQSDTGATSPPQPPIKKAAKEA